MKKNVSGIFAPITTPFINDELSIEHLRENMLRYKETPLHGFFVLGSNGENKSLSDDEKLRILEVVIQEKAEHQLVMAGTAFESTGRTIAFSKRAAELGADFVSVITPSYFKKRLTDAAVAGYYLDVAEELSIPLLVYNAPGFTGMTVSFKVIGQISRHPNIIGMKDTSPGNMSGYLDACDEDFQVLSGTVSTLFPAMILGASGGVVSLANAFPRPCCELFERFKAGDMEGARGLHYKLFRLNRSVSGSFGVAGVKYAMEVGGYFGGNPRLPLLPLKDTDRRLIKDAINEAGLL